MDERVVCTECARMVVAEPKVNFMGFPSFLCPECRRHAQHPLSRARLVTYAIIGLASVALAIRFAIVNGGPPIAGGIPLLMLVAIGMDVSVRRRFNRARAKAGA